MLTQAYKNLTKLILRCIKIKNTMVIYAKTEVLTGERGMIKEKYKQSRLAHQFGGMNAIGFKQTFVVIEFT